MLEKRREATADVAETGVAAEELKQFVERLEEEKKALSDDIHDVYAELKGRGFPSPHLA